MSVRRYVALVQDSRGYPPPGELDLAPPDGPEPPMLHSVVLVEDYERLEAVLEEARSALVEIDLCARAWPFASFRKGKAAIELLARTALNRVSGHLGNPVAHRDHARANPEDGSAGGVL